MKDVTQREPGGRPVLTEDGNVVIMKWYEWRTYVLTRTCPLCGQRFRWKDFREPMLKPTQYHASIAHEGCVADHARDRARDRIMDDD